MSAADPLGQRRLQIELPDVPGAEAVWALPCIPPGSRAKPVTGATVWVMVENSDLSVPVWIGVRPKNHAG
jgi:Type VI secretion system/phage-baseplate injector OB domain